MAKLPKGFETSPEDFSKGVDVIASLLSEGKARVRGLASGSISFSVPSSVLGDVSKAHGVEQELLSAVLREASAFATASMGDRTDNFVRLLVDRRRDQEGIPDTDKEQALAALHTKAQLVERQLVTEKVRRKHHAARASKHGRLVDIDWEILERKYDKDEAEKARGPVALIKFKIGRRSDFEAATLMTLIFGGPEPTDRELLVEFDDDDLLDLIDTLTKVHGKLREGSDGN